MVHPEVKMKILKELENLEWKTDWNHQANAIALPQAIKEMEQLRDLGYVATKNLCPKTDNHHDWMDYAKLLTQIHNRDQRPQKYTILRTEIKMSHLFSLYSIVYYFNIGGGGRFDYFLFSLYSVVFISI